ncbi:MAG: DUF4214 domain-containing protein [Acidimicrobiales bacterium]
MNRARCAGALAAILLVVSSVAATSSASAGTEPGAIGEAPTARYLDAAFRLFLGRAPSAAEVDSWSIVVHRGDLLAVTRSLAASDEWAGQRVDDLYRTVLGRTAEPVGRAHWVDQIAAGLQLEEVAARFFGSAEYYARVGASEPAFVDALYEALLGRTADTGGRSHWLGHLRRGMTRHQLARSFYASTESRRDRVAAAYREVLSRAPDPAGHRHWADRLLGLGEVELAASLAASSEFHIRATSLPAPSVRFAPVGPGTTYPLTHSWRVGCPVHHRDLLAVEFSHLRDDGRVAHGVLIVDRTAVADVATVVRTLYGSGFPLTSARPVDDFDGDDGRSMDADNSSAFNCRTVAGASTWSQHAYGLAIDLNPVRNPYVNGSRVEPSAGAAWTDRSNVRAGMVVEGGPVVEMFDRLGWGWGGRWSASRDHQHFSATGR